MGFSSRNILDHELDPAAFPNHATISARRLPDSRPVSANTG
jgi:hypothetical protein